MKNVMKIVMGAIAFVCACGANGAQREIPRSRSCDDLASLVRSAPRCAWEEVRQGSRTFDEFAVVLEESRDEALEDVRRVRESFLDLPRPASASQECVEALPRVEDNLASIYSFSLQLAEENRLQAQKIESQAQKIKTLKQKLERLEGLQNDCMRQRN